MKPTEKIAPDSHLNHLATSLAERYARLLNVLNGQSNEEFDRELRRLNQIYRAFTQLHKFAAASAKSAESATPSTPAKDVALRCPHPGEAQPATASAPIAKTTSVTTNQSGSIQTNPAIPSAKPTISTQPGGSMPLPPIPKPPVNAPVALNLGR